MRILLVIGTIHDRPSCSIGYVLAFPQADFDVPVYIELPVRFEPPKLVPGNYVLFLNKSLYGLKQAAVNWFGCLKDGLEACDFFQSNVDPFFSRREWWSLSTWMTVL